jgi:superfamily I DNA/RNA helicase
VRLVTYTRVLREFIASGCGDYVNFPASQVMTVAGWINEFLDEQGADRPNTRGLNEEESWNARLEALRVAATSIHDVYDALIVDEVQDLPGELLRIMHQLTPRLFMAGDKDQRIFSKDTKDSGISAASEIADDVQVLRYHYRVGQNICMAADRILTASEPLTSTCRYNSPLGSRVEAHRVVDIEAQCHELVERITNQLRTYGSEPIGIIAARWATCEAVFGYLQQSPLGDRVKLMSSSSSEPWYDDARPICIMTLQAAKGSEFRAVHWISADDVPYFTRQKAYMITTRAKTALDVYHSQRLRPVLASAYSELRPPRAPF